MIRPHRIKTCATGIGVVAILVLGTGGPLSAELDRDSFLVGRGDLFGVIGSGGSLRTPLKYRFAGRWRESGYLWVAGGGHPPTAGNFISAKGSELLPFPARRPDGALDFELPEFTAGRAAVRIDGRSHVLVSERGEVLGRTTQSGAATHHLDRWFVALEDGKVGFANAAGKLVIPARFDDARVFKGDLAPVREDGLWGLVHRDATYAMRPRYHDVRLLTERSVALTYWGVRLDNRWGIADAGGELAVPPRFESIPYCSHGLAVVSVDGALGVLEIAGNKMLGTPSYERIRPPDADGVWLRREGKWGRIALDGGNIVPFQFDRISQLAEGCWEVRNNGDCGVVSATGETIVEAVYSDVSSMDRALARVRKGRLFGVVDLRTGKSLLAPEYESVRVYSQFRRRIALVQREGKWGAVSLASGEPVIPIRFDALDPWWPPLLVASSQGIFELYTYGGTERLGRHLEIDSIAGTQEFENGYGKVASNGRFGLVRPSGEVGIPCRYDEIGMVADGFVAAKQDGKWGYLRLDGRWSVEPAFDEAHPFSAGSAAVRKDGRVGYIDVQGKSVIPFEYQDGGCAFAGLFPVARRDPESKSMRWGLVDAEGKPVLPIEYEALEWPYPGPKDTRLYGRQTWIDL